MHSCRFNCRQRVIKGKSKATDLRGKAVTEQRCVRVQRISTATPAFDLEFELQRALVSTRLKLRLTRHGLGNAMWNVSMQSRFKSAVGTCNETVLHTRACKRTFLYIFRAALIGLCQISLQLANESSTIARDKSRVGIFQVE